MDKALTQKFPFILDRNLAKANCTENHVCTSCDTVVWILPRQINKERRFWISSISHLEEIRLDIFVARFIDRIYVSLDGAGGEVAVPVKAF